MQKDYLPILLQVIVAIGFVAAALIFSVILGKAGRRNPAKDTPYECGMLPQGGAQSRFSVKFYLVAMLFILFDIEIVFMYPWAVVYREFVSGPGLFLASHGDILEHALLRRHPHGRICLCDHERRLRLEALRGAGASITPIPLIAPIGSTERGRRSIILACGAPRFLQPVFE